MKRINALINTEYRSQWQDSPVFLAPRSVPAAGTARPGQAAWWARLRAGLSSLAVALRRARARRITYRQLATLDDNLLADIGLRREQLREYADQIVARRGTARQPAPCTVTELSTRRTAEDAELAPERAA